MEVADPFAPSYDVDESSNGHDEWQSPFESPAVESAPVSFGADVHDDAIERAKQLAGQLSSTVVELSQALSQSEGERSAAQTERAELLNRIQSLEHDSARKQQFRDAVLNGQAASLTADDVRALQSVTESLTADPDRLTTLFSVVQQASKLGTVVSVYAELRSLVEGE